MLFAFIWRGALILRMVCGSTGCFGVLGIWYHRLFLFLSGLSKYLTYFWVSLLNVSLALWLSWDYQSSTSITAYYWTWSKAMLQSTRLFCYAILWLDYSFSKIVVEWSVAFYWFIIHFNLEITKATFCQHCDFSLSCQLLWRHRLKTKPVGGSEWYLIVTMGMICGYLWCYVSHQFQAQSILLNYIKTRLLNYYQMIKNILYYCYYPTWFHDDTVMHLVYMTFVIFQLLLFFWIKVVLTSPHFVILVSRLIYISASKFWLAMKNIGSWIPHQMLPNEIDPDYF